MIDDFRGTGNTTRQMQAAPQKAIFVWSVSNSVPYAKDLARKLGRDDLEIVTTDWIESERWRGLELSGIVIDHATRLSSRLIAKYRAARTRIRSSVAHGQAHD